MLYYTSQASLTEARLNTPNMLFNNLYNTSQTGLTSALRNIQNVLHNMLYSMLYNMAIWRWYIATTAIYITLIFCYMACNIMLL